jgi:hypothetical protein
MYFVVSSTNNLTESSTETIDASLVKAIVPINKKYIVNATGESPSNFPIIENILPSNLMTLTPKLHLEAEIKANSITTSFNTIYVVSNLKIPFSYNNTSAYGFIPVSVIQDARTSYVIEAVAKFASTYIINNNTFENYTKTFNYQVVIDV